MILMKFLTLLFFCLISVLQPLKAAELQDKDQAALNRVYVMFNRAFNELDSVLWRIYTPRMPLIFLNSKALP